MQRLNEVRVINYRVDSVVHVYTVGLTSISLYCGGIVEGTGLIDDTLLQYRDIL